MKIIDVTASILIKDGELFIAKRPHSDQLAGKWELPGGKIKPGETPEECLEREINEEFGIDITVQELFSINTHHYDHISVKLISFIVQWVGGEIFPAVHEDIRWVAASEIDKYDFASADIPIINEIRRKKLVF